ncbi:adenine phosphoribosyltransferase [Babesia caballi]|uniref:adenine phosphoribosyltransferase n=1 Tax=Babesia caballi TaxID=5871 RepID=A0AAV4LMF7_BABCB|nr:adenine phosphoribosyltransferase [Babesia caballi]GIX60585.1 adenine phosphoribosyltransferase [Babesia caballi]
MMNVVALFFFVACGMVAQAFQLTEEDFRIFTDFKPGIRFVDIMPVLKDDYKFRETIKVMAEGIRQRHPEGVDYIAALELRGVPFAAPLAYELCCGLVIIRKPGKLPGPIISTESSHSYGTTDLTMQADAVEDGARVVIVDDLLALGGTLSAACRLLRELKAKILECLVVVEIPGAPGRENIQKAFPEVPVNSVMNFYLPPKNA